MKGTINKEKKGEGKRMVEAKGKQSGNPEEILFL